MSALAGPQSPPGCGPVGELDSLPLLPAYGSASLAELLPSVLACLLSSDAGPDAGPAGVLGLRPVRRAGVLLVDGLGASLLAEHADVAPTLAQALGRGRELTSAFPSTTATSLATLGTGLPPGRHGITGYTVALPGTDRVMSSLSWDPSVDPLLWQPEPTVFEQAAGAGIAVTRVGPGAFHGSGLTTAAMRGGDYVGVETAGQRAAALVDALGRGDRSIVYGYYGDLDLTGHVSGCTSPAWREELALVDAVVARLVATLPRDAALWVTADHGMVDVPVGDRLDLATEPELTAGLRLVAGEPRARHLHTRPGAAPDVLATWLEVLGDRAWVRSGAEAVDEGWFGEVHPRVRERIGDVVVACRDTVAVVDSRVETPSSLALVGHHGSLTPAEVRVPLLEWRA